MHRNGFHLWQIEEVRVKCLFHLKIWIFFFKKKKMDSLQEAFIHAPEPCEVEVCISAGTDQISYATGFNLRPSDRTGRLSISDRAEQEWSKVKTLMLAYSTTTSSAPSYFHSLLRIYIPSRSLRSASEWRPRGTIKESLKITLQNILIHHSWLVEWSSHPYPESWIPVNLQATTENSSLSTLLDFFIK